MKKYFMLLVVLFIISLTSSLMFFANYNDKVIEILSVNQLSKVQSTFEEIRSYENENILMI